MDHGRWTLTSTLSSLLALLVVGAALAAFWQPGVGFLLILLGLVEAAVLLAAMLSRTGYLLRDVLLSILPTGGLAILAGALAVDAGSRQHGPPERLDERDGAAGGKAPDGGRPGE